MKLDITFDISDAALVDGFAAATGWRDKSGITKEDWLIQKTKEFIVQRGRSGFISDRTQTARDAYVTAIKGATTDATTVIPAITKAV